MAGMKSFGRAYCYLILQVFCLQLVKVSVVPNIMPHQVLLHSMPTSFSLIVCCNFKAWELIFNNGRPSAKVRSPTWQIQIDQALLIVSLVSGEDTKQPTPTLAEKVAKAPHPAAASRVTYCPASLEDPAASKLLHPNYIDCPKG